MVAVPWARHHAGRMLDDTVAWLAVACSKTAVCELMRIARRTVGTSWPRSGPTPKSALTGSRTPHRLLSMRSLAPPPVPDGGRRSDSGRLVWAAPGHDKATPGLVLQVMPWALSRPPRLLVPADADWIADMVTERCLDAIQCADPFHVVAWATEGAGVEAPSLSGDDARAIARTRPVRSGPAVERRTTSGREAGTAAQGARLRAVEELRTSPSLSAKLAWIAGPVCIAPTCSKRACGMCFR